MVTHLVVRISYNHYPGYPARQADRFFFGAILPEASHRTMVLGQKHQGNPLCPASAAELGVNSGMADAAERYEVGGVVVCRVAVDMVDMEIFFPTTDGALIPIALKHSVPYLLPPSKAILVPDPDGDLETLAVDRAPVPHGKRAPAAEPAKTVPGGVVSTEGRF